MSGEHQGAGGLAENLAGDPMKAAYPYQDSPRCSANSKRTGRQCGAPAERGKAVCRFHGARGGGPRGEANGAYRNGGYTAEAIEDRRCVAALVKSSRKLIAQIEGGRPRAKGLVS